MIKRRIAVQCDRSNCHTIVALRGPDASDVTVAKVRQEARWQHWTTGARGDFCPTHRAGA